MHPAVRDHLLSVLESAKRALDQNAVEVLRNLSETVVSDASMFQDEDAVSVAVLLYAFSKLVPECVSAGKSLSSFSAALGKARQSLAVKDFSAYNLCLKDLFSAVRLQDNKLSQYISEVLQKARIKKGSVMHDQGVSIARTAHMMGVSQWELMSYIGKTTIADEAPLASLPVKKRLQLARELFS